MSRDDGASEVPRLPFRRIIILSSDGMCWLGAACAISLAQSPMLRPDKQGCCTQIIIANHFNTPQMILSGDECLSRGVKSIPSLTALEALCSDIPQGSAVLQRVGIAVDAAQCPHVVVPHFTADFTHDVFIYIAAWSDAVCGGHTSILSLAALTHAAASQQEHHTPLTTPDSSRHRPCGRLILLVDDATRPAVVATATRALLLHPPSTDNSSSSSYLYSSSSCSSSYYYYSHWRLFLAGAPQLAPPAGDFRLTRAVVRRGGAGRGVLEGVALGVALGVLRRLPAAFREALPAAPLDLAAHTALLALARQEEKEKEEKKNKKKKPKKEEEMEIEGMEIGIGGDLSVRAVAGEGWLVWGMFAEYLMDYYSRVGTTIAKEFPLPKLMDPQPTLQLNASVPDWINYGFSLMMPFKCYYGYCETQRRKELLNYFPGSKTVKCLRTAIDNIDMAVHSVTKMVKPDTLPNQSSQLPKSLAKTGNGYYYYYSSLIQEIVGNDSLRSLYPFISLNCVKWDIFVKVIAEGVIEQFAWQVSNHSLSLPPPLPQYHNDIVFHGTRRALPTNLCPRKFFTDMHWVVRCGMHPDGIRVSTEPGLTKKLQEHILKQPEVLKAIGETAKAENSSITVVEKRSEGILRTIGDNLNQVQVRTFGLMVRRLLFQLYDEVTLNNEAFERLYRVFHTPRVHVMLLPAHRSYVDFIIITYLLVAMNFSPPHVCAGEDFLRMGPISKLMRGSGAFFIRRSFRGDKLYQTIFKEYVRQLVLHRQVIEFFIEGTRSRTGKMVAPKLGILKFITDTFFEGQNMLDDVYILPISLSYDELLEAKLYADEQLGISKPKESIGNLLRARSLLKTRHGKIHVHVGEVISLKNFQDNPYQCPVPFEPIKENNKMNSNILVKKNDKSPTPLPVLTNLAWHITHNIQENTVITPTALLATILSVFAPTKTGMLLDDIYIHMSWLRLHIIKRKGALSIDCSEGDIKGMTHYAISHLSTFIEVLENDTKVLIRQDVGSFMGISICSNQLIHVFLDEAVIAIVAYAFGKINKNGKSIYVQKIDLKNGCEQLRKLLSGEFQDYLPSCPYTFTSWFENALSRLQSCASDDDGDSNSYYKPNKQNSITAPSGIVVSRNPTDDKNEEKKDNKREEIYLTSDNVTDITTTTIIIMIPITKQFSLLHGILFPFVESTYIISLAVSAIITDHPSSARELRKGPLLKAARKVSLELYHSNKLIMCAQSCGNESLKNALEGVVMFTSLRNDISAREPTYVLPTTVTHSTISAEMQTLLDQLRRLHIYFVLNSEEEKEEKEKEEKEQEQFTKNLFLTSYREFLAATKQSAKI